VTPDRWRKIEELYHLAVAREESERTAFLDEACAGDEELRREVGSLLAQEKGAEGFLESPALQLAAKRMAQDQTPSLLGQRLGLYQVLSLLGAGGMGEVYRARDTRLQRDVAIKVLPRPFVDDPDRLSRFRREAQLLASLNHPNIATIHGLEEADGVHYLVMELVAGQALAERIERAGPLAVSEALSLCRQIGEGLEAAHEKGIVHRDLKPANVKITPEGRVKVLDFGLAKAFRGDSSETGLSNGLTVAEMGTEPGAILGTPAYMSPEQARGKAADKRTDIWAFGCVLYEALSGRRAFGGATPSDTVAALLEHEPDWQALPRTTPASIQALLRRCLRKDPSRRQHDIADARIEIEEALTETPVAVPAAAEPRPWRRAIPWGLAGLLAVIAAVALWSLWRGGASEQRHVIRFAVAPPQGQVVGDPDAGVAISPDGNQIAYVPQTGDGQRQIYLRQLNELEGKPVRGTEGAAHPVFSPDGKWLAFVHGGGPLEKVSLSGGDPQPLYDYNKLGKGWYFSNSWTPDGDALIFGTDSGLLQVSAAGGKPGFVSRAVQDLFHGYPQILPGGKAVLFTAVHELKRASVDILSLETGERRTLIEPGTCGRYVASGHLVYVWEKKLLAAPFDLGKLKLTAPPAVVLEGVATTQAAKAQFEVSKNGTLVYVPASESENRQLVWVDRRGAVKPVAAPPRPYENPRLSPDGRRVATSFRRGIWIYTMRSETLSRLTFGDERWPLWTPDGKRVTFSACTLKTCKLFSKPADGSGSEELLTESEHSIDASSWSPDGQVLAFIGGIEVEHGDIWLLPLCGDRKPRPFLQTESKKGTAVFSPDGHWLAYTSDESGQFEVYVQPFSGPGGRWQISTEGGDQPIWAHNGKELFYREGNKIMAVEVTTRPAFSAGSPRPLFAGQYLHSPQRPADYDVTPDGQRFLMVQPGLQEASAQQINVVLNWFEELKRLVPVK
jgi:serine/threonine protein kinase/Tol biopolymer transport system component